MNERIKELLDQCINKDMTDKPWPLVDTEKFAKLIIDECTNKVLEEMDICNEDVREITFERINKHFGVKQ